MCSSDLALQHSPAITCLATIVPRRGGGCDFPMLYNAYELQRSMLAGASAVANFSAGLLNNPANPFAYFGGGPMLASALEVFAHAAAPRGKPEFGLDSTRIDGKQVAVHEEIVLRKPFGHLKPLVRERGQSEERRGGKGGRSRWAPTH